MIKISLKRQLAFDWLTSTNDIINVKRKKGGHVINEILVDKRDVPG